MKPRFGLIFSELERQKTIAENRSLLENLGLDPTGASKIPGRKPPPPTVKAKAASAASKKRKSAAAEIAPRRRSGRIAGFDATVEEVAKKEEEDEKEREVLRVINRRIRHPVMKIEDMVDEDSSNDGKSLVRRDVYDHLL